MPEIKVIKFPEGRYEGQVDENDVPHGEGEFEYPGNDDLERQIYIGHFKQKKAHGRGLLRYREGDKYEGEWEDGLRHGQGEYFSKASGAKYEGEYQNDVKHGRGKYTYPNGDVYNGEWNEGKRHGKGLYRNKETGGVYEGEWVNGVKHGEGTYVFGETGDVFKGTYEDNQRHGEGFLEKVDGEKRTENWKLGKLVNFTVTEERKKSQ